MGRRKEGRENSGTWFVRMVFVLSQSRFTAGYLEWWFRTLSLSVCAFVCARERERTHTEIC